MQGRHSRRAGGGAAEAGAIWAPTTPETGGASDADGGGGAAPAASEAKTLQFAMISLFTVILTDVYIMAVVSGWITDLRIVN